jgi:hypothetical protein
MWYARAMTVTRSQPTPALAPITVEEVPYGGWRRNLRLANGDAELVITLDVGPRVIRYGAPGAPNLLAEAADQLGKAGEPGWMPRGGHRLWTAPEDEHRTYAPDNGPVAYMTLPDRPGEVRVTQPPDQPYGVQKEIDFALAPSGSGVRLVHRITNVGKAPIEVSVWALTVMPPGGTAVVPLPAKRPHPGSMPTRKASDYWASQVIGLWSYLDLKDPRLDLGTRFVTVRQDPQAKTQFKLGLSHESGGLGYWRDGDLFVKWVDYQAGATYPDRGCNFQVYTDPNILEVETLGPLVTIEPGQKVEHVERWAFHRGVGPIGDEARVAANVAAHLKG